MYLAPAPRPGHALLAHLRRHPFLYASVLLHAVLITVLGNMAGDRARLETFSRQRHAIESGQQMTAQARLEKRVHDMARIESLLEQSTALSDARKTPPASNEDDVQFSAQPKSPHALLEQARTLSRKIDAIERDTKAAQLAKLLKIPKEKALAQVDAARPPEKAASPVPPNAADAAAQIAKLETKARAVLEARRQELERQQDGTPVQAGESGAAGKAAAQGKPGSMQSGKGQDSAAAAGIPGTPGARNGPGGQGQGSSVAGAIPGGPENTVLARIARFANPDLPDRATQAYLSGSLGPMFGGGTGTIPDANPATMIRGAGRMIGPGGAYANRVYVNRWYLIGPFDGKHGAALFANDRHPPEEAVVLDAVYRGKGDRLLKWEYVDMGRYPLIPPDAAEDAVYYGYTELMLDADRDLTIWVGADDDAQLWVNDALVWKGGNTYKQWFFDEIYTSQNHGVRDYNLSEGKRIVHFRKGRNKLFFKLSNGPTRLFFSLVLTQELSRR